MMEQNNLLEEFNEPGYESAGTGQRLANYIIDVILYYIVFYIGIIIAGLSAAASGLDEQGNFDDDAAIGTLVAIYLLMLAIFLAYYTFLEGSKGKTIGKMVTRTKVVRTDGQPMTYRTAFLRTLCRLVPFEPISAFFGAQMWHDSWTKTMVVKDK